ncbi:MULTISPECIES: cation transporter [unclassified Neptuniibacter]|jgi:Co/Zn/Cd efflux system component|uniref:cation transporter n=1 Tax=unclassified Neptuniibacter TaxID=2630693 RepID=UPI0026E17129|nr:MULTISPECIES: cation transporter [unclassified Neptuniibacter]MDO6514096.1 cation transporter [Neptuniibacter sp. 2_MG-2023]MDO6594067.1 cation transporter [Neptuniibacter sp. 1_MG-2023]
MGSCCNNDNHFDGASIEYKRALWWVIAINALMFFIEMGASVQANSQALQADALDFLGDTATYSLSLLVIGKSLQVRNRAALFKATSLMIMGIGVFGITLYKVIYMQTPKAVTMGSVGALAFTANLISVMILLRFRNGDANVRSVWLCSRNDAIGNIAVMIAALGVWQSASAWPDLIVASIMAGLFSWSAIQIFQQVSKSNATAKP